MFVDKIFYWIFYSIWWLIGRLLRMIFFGLFGLFQRRKMEAEIRRQEEAMKPKEPTQEQWAGLLPLDARFGHTEIVAGSGHGKTELLKHLINLDLDKMTAGQGSIVVIDSQGDLIRSILSLGLMKYVSDRLVIIDPNDVEYPPALNLFDLGLERLQTYDPLEREKLINGTISLYEYLFGALLGAELTSRQGTVFRYLAQLMMVVPNATILTLLDFIEEPEKVRPYLSKLDPLPRRFFEKQFLSDSFDDTRQQISARLWHMLSTKSIARMFSATRNKVDIFDAMNRGSLILINTAKELLKQEGTELMGRFFIALICQAAQERAVIPENKRRATFVYIDEAHDYFDDNIEMLLTTARKYKVGLVLSHQSLSQYDTRLREIVMANTNIKLAGGVSSEDAKKLAPNMGGEVQPEWIMDMQKRTDKGLSEFLCSVKSKPPFILYVQLGLMDAQPRLSEEDKKEIIENNRKRFAEKAGEEIEIPMVVKPLDAGLPVRPEIL